MRQERSLLSDDFLVALRPRGRYNPPAGRPGRVRGGGPVNLSHGIPGIAVLALLGFVLFPVQSALPSAHDPQCARWRSAFLGMPTRTLLIQLSEARRIAVPVKLAATAEARSAGFQCATIEEIQATVVVFDFGTEVLAAFHMRNVPAPLDIAFAEESGRLFAILRMEPSPTKVYGPMGAFRYAIEAREGFFAERGISPGHFVFLQTPN